MRMHAEFQKHNMFRRPDWRWERVLAIIDRPGGPGRCTTRDDQFVREGRKFVFGYRDRSEEEREALFWRMPGLFYAYTIHASAEDDYEPALFLQARLLSGQSVADIAEAMTITPETVEWYERMFFNVSDRLRGRDWITKQILLPAVMRNHDGTPRLHGTFADGTHNRDGSISMPFLDGTLKMFAYFGGKYLVDVMISGFQQGKPLTGQEDMAAWFDHHFSMTIRRRSHQAAMTFDVNKFNVMELFRVHTEIMAIGQSDENKDQAKTLAEKHVKAMIDGIPWSTGSDGEAVVAGTPLEEFDAYAAELRDDEVIRVQAGADAAELRAEVGMARLPAPRMQRFKLEKSGKSGGD